MRLKDIRRALIEEGGHNGMDLERWGCALISRLGAARCVIVSHFIEGVYRGSI